MIEQIMLISAATLSVMIALILVFFVYIAKITLEELKSHDDEENSIVFAAAVFGIFIIIITLISFRFRLI